MAASETAREGDPIVGRTLGDFVIHERLDGGGFGTVYRAEQQTLGRGAAVKVLHMRHSGREHMVQRFTREARLASRLDHPYAAHVYSFGAEPDGLLWIAMEWVRGTSLHELLKREGPLPLERCVPLFERVCEVVQAAHEIGIVHRDLKPANVMILSRGGQLFPKLLDFGVAKDLGRSDDSESRVGETNGSTTLTGTDDIQLTKEGVTVGSPPFMAPEQWKNRDVGPRADVYSLGVMAFCMLTGRYPFEASTPAEMAAAHVRMPVPPLGPSFAPALDAVIAHAMAKKPADRYPSAADLAIALRNAAGTDAIADDLPALDPTVRDALLSDAPQPLAETVALLDAARSLDQARSAALQIAQVLARYLAAVALAARCKIGPGPGDHVSADRELDERLRKLRRGGLAPDEWLGLARALVRPFTEHPTAHPMPELVELLGAGDPFGNLLDRELHDDADQVVKAVSALLRRISFLSDYPLAVGHNGVPERWMGLRRASRARLQPRGAALVDDRPILLDRNGAFCLSLWPLVQVASPLPRADRELFLVDGQSRSGARLVSLPSGFRHHDDELFAWLSRRSGLPGDDASGDEREASVPYLGLSTFSTGDSAVFFGRERETEIAVNRLAAQPLLAVVGPSGAGKSSFVSAGVLAAIGERGAVVSVRPGPTPLQTLEARLVREGAGAAGLAAALREDPEALGRCLRGLAATHRRQAILVIDQFEELFTLGADAGERALYAQALCLAAAEVARPVRVILTLRDDFLIRAQELQAMREPLGAGLQLLSTPNRDDLVRILVEPARRHGFAFQDENLPKEMVAQVASEPGALPLLSFTALRLWEQRDRHFKQLTRGAYTALGGVGGALARHAEDLLSSMSEAEQRLVREAFRHLVTAEGTRAVLRRGELLDVLGRGALAEGVVEKLIGARLAVAQEGEGGQERIEIVHETLTQAWPRLVRWQKEDAEGARLRDQLRAAARQWEERGQAEGLLWRGEALAELQLWRSRHGRALTTAERDFADASARLSDRARRLRRLLVSGAFAALAIGLFVLFRANQRSERSADESRARLSSFYEEQGRQSLLDADPLRALVNLSEARQLGRDDLDLRYLVGQAALTLDAEQQVLRGHQGRVFEAALHHGRVLTAGSDDTARLWDAADGRALASWEMTPLWSAELSPDGRTALVFGKGQVRVYHDGASTPAWSASGLESERGAYILPKLARFSPDGTLVALAAGDHSISLRDARDGRVLGTLRGHTRSIRSIAFSTAGQLVSGDVAARVIVWDVGARRATADVTLPHTGALYHVALSPDGKLVLGCGETSTIDVWDVAEKRVRLELGATVRAFAGEFSRDGRWLTALGEVQQRVQLWRTAGQPGATLLTHGSVGSVEFSPDNARLLAASADGLAWIWNVEDGTRSALLAGHTGDVWRAHWSEDGERVVTTGVDGTARIWRAAATGLRHSLHGKHEFYDSVPRADGKVVSTNGDHLVRLWNASDGSIASTYSVGDDVAGEGERMEVPTDDGERVLVMRGHALTMLDADSGAPLGAPFELDQNVSWATVSPDHARLAIAGDKGVLVIVDLATRTRVSVDAHRKAVIYCAFSPDGTKLISGGADFGLRLWDARTGAALLELRGHTAQVESAVFSPDGTQIASAGFSNGVRLWDARDGHLTGVLSGDTGQVMMLHYSPDGQLLATAGSSGARVWSVASGRPIAVWDGTTYSTRVSKEGDLVYLSRADGSARQYSLPSARWSKEGLDAYVRCHVPLRRQGNVIVPTPVVAAACASASHL